MFFQAHPALCADFPAPASHENHACYENKADLPPDHLQEKTENKIERLNKRTFGNASIWLPIPIWLGLINPFEEEDDEIEMLNAG
jgi:hypothetical protein